MFGWGKPADDGAAERRILAAVAGLQEKTTEALREGFSELRRQNAELREELRELRRAVTDAHKDVAEHRRETETLRQELQTARREAAGILAEAGARAEAEARARSAAGARARGEAEAETAAAGEVQEEDSGGRAERGRDQDQGGSQDQGEGRDRHTVAEPGAASGRSAPGSAPARSPGAERPEAAGPGPDEDTQKQRLERAAGISAADLVCHRDTWAFIVEQAARNAHFRVPGEITAGKDGATRITVSGRSLMAILTALDAVERQDHRADPGDRALAGKIYERITDVVDTVGPGDGHGRRAAAGHAADETPQRAVIVIDDRPGPP
ncbi:hypothetical protein [Streptomyces sp. NPDC008001]|uniref:hypothetical protein n=1 Tax=Streptomyces sp. NPDC008001 TaxID=3364804 RepID=UPI0036E9FD07